jgi:hypothetical protein
VGVEPLQQLRRGTRWRRFPVLVAFVCHYGWVTTEQVASPRSRGLLRGRRPNPQRPWFYRELINELKWSFAPPRVWLAGVAANLVLSLLWLIVAPLTGHDRGDWVVLVGSYFATFILADVTTTNVLGPDQRRIRKSMDNGVPFWRLLLVKNVTLILLVGLPTLAVTAALTLFSEDSYRLGLTLPGVAFPILTWLGVGNVVSVLLPVAWYPLRARWEQRRDLIPTARWLGHLALPYALLYAVAPVNSVPRAVLGHVSRQLRTPQFSGMVMALTGASVWIIGTILAALIVRYRGFSVR